jgi:crossover junction endodeoxyribonuclease RuvC
LSTTLPTRIALGIDPGLAIVGYAIVAARGNALALLACDVVTTPPGVPVAQRLQTIYDQLGRLIRWYHPAEASMERLFFGKNARTAMPVAQARGVALLAVTGYGGAEKRQVGEMVRVLLHLPAVPRPDDAADAAAVAICHLYTAAFLARVTGG